MLYKEISAKEIPDNLIKKISDEWALVSAGNEDKYNMMTVSWGFAGELWGKDCMIALIRPSRYTLEFMEREDYFTFSFLGDNKSPHKICGSKSGRDIDKTKEANLHPVFSDNGVYFEEAETVIICKKAYLGELKAENFIDKEALEKWYDNDLHKVFIGEIKKVLVK